ncbi:MAG: hypothetical protein LBE81_11970 [Azonexus sp.]|jgi:hypothetical protein|uniref:hypothetical protein n=1 Tax=Azonexus sp. TaxID=1872668 RepID=UPI0028173E89|nr:hypothetical protein [Azonexus sp.]MDR0777336.1 hypothetical protein [Azonexus sp.]
MTSDKAAARERVQRSSNKPKTTKSYVSLTKHHLDRMTNQGLKITAKGIADYMKQLAYSGELTKSSWYKLRCALASTQELGGFKDSAERLRALKFPTDAKPKPRPRRAKGIDGDDYATLHRELAEKGDSVAWAYLVLARHLGCRPAEVINIAGEIDGNATYFIPSAKKRADGRGLDRFVEITDQRALAEVRRAFSIVQKVPATQRKNLHNVARKRIARTAAGLWPRRAVLPTLYTLRHQMGSDLKASGMSEVECAAIMGHQSTRSIGVYGWARAGRGAVSVRPTRETLARVRKIDPRGSVPVKTPLAGVKPRGLRPNDS